MEGSTLYHGITFQECSVFDIRDIMQKHSLTGVVLFMDGDRLLPLVNTHLIVAGVQDCVRIMDTLTMTKPEKLANIFPGTKIGFALYDPLSDGPIRELLSDMHDLRNR